MDPRAGLRRKPQFLELEARARKGTPKKTGLSYNPLRVLFDPMHVKMAQQMREGAREQTQRIIVEQKRQHDVRDFASQTGVDIDMAANLMPRKSESEPDSDSLRKWDDADMMGPAYDDDDDDDDDPGGGGGPGGMGGGLGGYAARILINPAASSSQPEAEPRTGNAGTLDEFARRGPGPPPPPSAGISYREAVEVKAEVDALRTELQRQTQRQIMAEEIRRGMQVKNPVKEIIREIHHVPQPQAYPVPFPVQTVNTNQLMEAAKRSGVDVGMLTEKLAISRAQLAEALSKKPAEMSVEASSSGPPPPPPPPRGRVLRSRSPPGKPKMNPIAEVPAVSIPTRPLSKGSEPPEKRGRPECFQWLPPAYHQGVQVSQVQLTMDRRVNRAEKSQKKCLDSPVLPVQLIMVHRVNRVRM